ncbi:MAG: glycoside hydrolase family 65 protein, partial [Actinobacteria bacterium]|nr:glycoside hydrolase family 65 protein [Actinomycetota bacterium]
MQASPVAELRRDFGEDPWRLVVSGIDPALAGQDETLFSLGNGYLGLRGNHEEGLPLGSHGTFINGLHETWRIQHAENAYGLAEHGQTIVNAPDAKTIRIYVDDERLNLNLSDILDVQRILDLRSGTLMRSLLWLTPTGKRVRVETRRMVSFVSRHLATIEMRITVLDADAELTVSSLLLNRHDLGRVYTEQAVPVVSSAFDPRKSEHLLERVLEAGPALHDDRGGDGSGGRSVLSYRVRNSGMALGVGIEHEFDGGSENWRSQIEAGEDRVRHVFQGTARRGRTVKLVKTVTYHNSATAALPEMVDRCLHTLQNAAAEPPEERWELQRRFLDEFWQR